MQNQLSDNDLVKLSQHEAAESLCFFRFPSASEKRRLFSKVEIDEGDTISLFPALICSSARLQSKAELKRRADI